MREVAQPQADDFAERMGDARQLLEVEGRVELNVAQRVKVLDGDV